MKRNFKSTIARKTLHSGISVKASDVARICMSCDLSSKKCGINCERYKEEIKRIKENNYGRT